MTFIGMKKSTAKQVSRLVGEFEREFREYDPPPGAGAAGTRFFTLLEDMPSGHGVFAWAEFYTWSNLIEVGKLYNWGNVAAPSVGIIDGAAAGYWGTGELTFGRWRFEQGPCIVRTNAMGTLTYPDPLTSGTNGAAYSQSPSAIASIDANSIVASGLPTGLTINDTTGVISGTPVVTGTFPITITATSPKTGGGSATITIFRFLEIAE